MLYITYIYVAYITDAWHPQCPVELKAHPPPGGGGHRKRCVGQVLCSPQIGRQVMGGQNLRGICGGTAKRMGLSDRNHLSI